MDQTSVPKFEQWAIVEVMGHARFAGYVTEQPIAGSSLIRVDVPEIPERKEIRKQWLWDAEKKRDVAVDGEVIIQGSPAFTKLFGVGSIYAITPCTEEAARKAADHDRSPKVIPIGLPAQRQLGTGDPDDGDTKDDDDNDPPY